VDAFAHTGLGLSMERQMSWYFDHMSQQSGTWTGPSQAWEANFAQTIGSPGHTISTHEANTPSGGKVTDIGIGAFVSGATNISSTKRSCT
jgi:hypothetical protein